MAQVPNLCMSVGFDTSFLAQQVKIMHLIT